MKAKTFALVGAGTLMLAGAANADILGLSWEAVDNTNPNVAIDQTIDLFIVTSGEDASVGAVTNININIVGGTFFNSPFGGNTAPNAALFGAFPEVEFDTFLTLQAVTDDQQPGAPSFPDGAPILGETNITALAMVGLPPDDPAYTPQFDADSGEWRVLVARLSGIVDAGRGDGMSFNGTMDIAELGNANGDLGGASFDTAPIPAPGALALLGLAGFAGSRRRRK